MIDLAIGLACVIIAALLCLPRPGPYIHDEPHSEIERLRYDIMARTGHFVFEIRLRGGHWEARTHTGWHRTTDLLSRAEFE